MTSYSRGTLVRTSAAREEVKVKARDLDFCVFVPEMKNRLLDQKRCNVKMVQGV
jgi:hypothetical protein